MDSLLRKKYLRATYLILIIYGIHYYSVSYTLSTFLNQYFSDSTLSLLFALGAILPIGVAVFFGKILRKYSNKKTILISSLIQLLATSAIIFANHLNIYLIATLFLIIYTLYSVIYTSINIFTEEFADRENSGSIRGVFLTIINLGNILAPAISSSLFDSIGYPGLFALSTLSILALLIFVKIVYRDIQEPTYSDFNILQRLKSIKTNPNILGVFASSFSLNIYYAVLDIYITLYLITIIQMPVPIVLGVLIPISMIPTITLTYALGKYSTKFTRIKNVMLLGTLIIGVTLISIYVFDIHTANVLVWGIILFILRTGTTLTEIENYTYFYRIVDRHNAGLTAIFQNITNLGVVFIAILGAILIKVFTIKISLIFLIAGLISLSSLWLISKIGKTNYKAEN